MDKTSLQRKKLYEEFFSFIEKNKLLTLYDKNKHDGKYNITQLGRLFKKHKGDDFDFSENDARRARYALDIKSKYPELYQKISIGECESFYRFKLQKGERIFNEVKSTYLRYLDSNPNSLSYLKGIFSEYDPLYLRSSDLDLLKKDASTLASLLKTLENPDEVSMLQLRRQLAKLCNSSLRVNAEYLRYRKISEGLNHKNKTRWED